MEHALAIAKANLLSPLVLFFVLGILAVLVNSDLRVPDALYNGYTMIILLTIGIRGGAELAHAPLGTILPILAAALGLSLLMVLLAFVVLRYLYRFGPDNAAAIAAHYGSVSAVTFAAATSFLQAQGIAYERYLSIVLAVLESPAILFGILLYKWSTRNGSRVRLGGIVKEAVFGKSIFLLLGGIVIGMISNENGIQAIKPLFGDLFYGLLCIFLLHMGMVSCQNLRRLERFRPLLFSFAFVFPVIGGTLGVFVGKMLGMSLGGATMLGVLTASASYIAAPAAISQAIPSANPGLYLSASIGFTLPFNLVVGIPIYFWLANVW